MTDPKALIAEARDIEAEASARAAQALTQGQGAPAAFLSRVAQNARRLAAALEEATPPEGWRVTEYRAEDGSWCEKRIDGMWQAGNRLDGPLDGVAYPTARAAMEALEEK